MANCPNCGRKLRLIDWKPECPGCGVNLNYFESNKRLLDESEKAEIEHSKFQPRVDRCKAAYVGSKLTIARIVLSLLPVGGLFLPLCSLNGEKMNIIAVYKAISAEDIGGFLLSTFSGNLTAAATVCLALSAVLILVNLIALTASLGKHGKGRTITLTGIMALAAIAAPVLFAVSGKGSLGAGAFVFAALQVFVFIWNMIIIKKGVPVKYKQCLIGGLPDKLYYEYVNSGMSREELNRKMLIALANMMPDEEDEEVTVNNG